MPFFKSTHNIFVAPWEDEVFNPNWMNSDKMVLPPNPKWDYLREIQIEDVDIWEQIYYQSGGLGLYAAWCPFAEFYMITLPRFRDLPNSVETFYGSMASEKAYARAVELGMPVHKNSFWVDDEDMWLYTENNNNIKTIIT
jgi:hypothetical protein